MLDNAAFTTAAAAAGADAGADAGAVVCQDRSMARCTGFILTRDTIIRVAKVSSPRVVGQRHGTEA
jgi:hypothetical protein